VKPLIIGESNPYSDDPRCALLPWPRGATGDRLREILGLTDKEYLRAFDRRNLLVGAGWSAPRARSAADLILLNLTFQPRPALILLGRKVSAAFGFRDARLPGEAPPAGPLPRVVLLPHPSGRCRAWNDPLVRRRSADLVAPHIGGGL